MWTYGIKLMFPTEGRTENWSSHRLYYLSSSWGSYEVHFDHRQENEVLVAKDGMFSLIDELYTLMNTRLQVYN